MATIATAVALSTGLTIHPLDSPERLLRFLPMPDEARYRYPELRQSLASSQVVEVISRRRPDLLSVERLTSDALQSPLDFPAVLLAVLPDDRVALAVDPNAAEVERVLIATVDHLATAQPSGIDVVLGDEVCDSLRDSITAALAGKADVHVHRSDARDELRYIGADAGADPVYLNRFLVDADFVLPIVSDRSCSSEEEFEHAGVFPNFADTFSRRRFSLVGEQPDKLLSPSDNFAMTLGVQLVLSVAADEDGRVAAVNAGTPQSLHQWSLRQLSVPKESMDASIVVASLDGEQQQQTWLNAARAATCASRLLDGGGTIILWTRINHTPDRWQQHFSDAMDDSDDPIDRQSSEGDDVESQGHDGFPAWDNSELAAQQLGRIASEYRVLLHSDLSAESVEAIGLGVVDTLDDLARLTKSFASCGLLRAASQVWTNSSDSDDRS